MTNPHEIQEKFLNALVSAYTNYDIGDIATMMTDSFNYDSFWVIDGITNKADYLEYLSEKLKSMKAENKKTNFLIICSQSVGRPHLIFTPKTPQGDFGCFTADSNLQGQITQLHLTPSSFFAPLAYKDQQKFDEFMAKTN